MSTIQEKMAVYAPNAQLNDYFRLTEGNHRVEECGDIVMTDVRLFYLNMSSPWSKTDYPASCQALEAVHKWCKQGRDCIYFGEFNNPKIDDKVKYPDHEAGMTRLSTLEDTQAAVHYSNTRMLYELNGELLSSGPWVVADLRFPAQGPIGEYLSNYMKNGGLFRFSLRAITSVDRQQNYSREQRSIHQLITFDLITKEIDDAVLAELAQRESDRRLQNQRESDDPSNNQAPE